MFSSCVKHRGPITCSLSITPPPPPPPPGLCSSRAPYPACHVLLLPWHLAVGESLLLVRDPSVMREHTGQRAASSVLTSWKASILHHIWKHQSCDASSQSNMETRPAPPVSPPSNAFAGAKGSGSFFPASWLGLCTLQILPRELSHTVLLPAIPLSCSPHAISLAPILMDPLSVFFLPPPPFTCENSHFTPPINNSPQNQSFNNPGPVFAEKLKTFPEKFLKLP